MSLSWEQDGISESAAPRVEKRASGHHNMEGSETLAIPNLSQRWLLTLVEAEKGTGLNVVLSLSRERNGNIKGRNTGVETTMTE